MAKKKTAKKTTRKKRAKLSLVNAPDEKCFWVRDGQILRNLVDLERALKKMTDKIFAYHINKEKKDFLKWVDELLGDKKLAKALKKVMSRKSFLRVVNKRLKDYQL